MASPTETPTLGWIDGREQGKRDLAFGANPKLPTPYERGKALYDAKIAAGVPVMSAVDVWFGAAFDESSIHYGHKRDARSFILRGGVDRHSRVSLEHWFQYLIDRNMGPNDGLSLLASQQASQGRVFDFRSRQRPAHLPFVQKRHVRAVAIMMRWMRRNPGTFAAFSAAVTQSESALQAAE